MSTAIYVPQEFYWADPKPAEPAEPLQRWALLLIGACGNGNMPGGADRVAFVGDRIVLATALPDAFADLNLVVEDLGQFVKSYSDQIANEIGSEEFADLLSEVG